MNIEQKIDELTEGLTEVKPLKAPLQRSGGFIVAVSLLLVAVIFVVGLRSDFYEIARSPSFLLETFLSFIASASAVFAAIALGVPGNESNRLAKLVALLSALMWTGLIFSRYVKAGLSGLEPEFWGGYVCGIEIVAIGLVLATLLVFRIKKSAPTRLAATGFFVALATFGFSALALQFTCSSDIATHLLSWHLLPVFIMTMVGAKIGSRILKW